MNEKSKKEVFRLSESEKRGLKKALKGFKGEVYIFGSRLDLNKKGGDIDILLIPYEKIKNSLELCLKIRTRFFMECDEDIDVLIYRDHPFFNRILKHAKRINPEKL